MTPGRIALVVEHFDPARGGLESWTRHLAKALLENGYEVHVVAAEFTASDLPVIQHRFAPSDSPWQTAKNIEAVVATLSVDLVHDVGFGWSGNIFQPQTGVRMLNLARDLAAMPLIPRARKLFSPNFRRWRRALRGTERRQMITAPRIVAVSELVKREIVETYRIVPDKIIIIPNGVDLARFSASRRDRDRPAARQALGLSDEIVFLAVAHNFRLKGIDDAMHAFARIDDSRTRLIVAGDGPVADYGRQAKRMGIAARVSFLSRVAEVEKFYAAADIFLHPTHHDACSLATLEALAAGLPVITSSANGAADAMRSGREGFIVGPGDIAALAQAMTALLDPERRHAFGVAAGRLAPKLGFDANVARLLAVYADSRSSAASSTGA